MTDYSIFPKINATLNGASALLLITGRVLIARGSAFMKVGEGGI